MEKEPFNGMTGPLMLEILQKIILKGKEFIFGPTEENMRGNGKIIGWME